MESDEFIYDSEVITFEDVPFAAKRFWYQHDSYLIYVVSKCKTCKYNGLVEAVLKKLGIEANVLIKFERIRMMVDPIFPLNDNGHFEIIWQSKYRSMREPVSLADTFLVHALRHNVDPDNMIQKIDFIERLSILPEGAEIIYEYEYTRFLNVYFRSRLVEIAADFLVEDYGLKPPIEKREEYAKKIVEAFPSLKDSKSETGHELFYDAKHDTGFLAWQLKQITENKDRRYRNPYLYLRQPIRGVYN